MIGTLLAVLVATPALPHAPVVRPTPATWRVEQIVGGAERTRRSLWQRIAGIDPRPPFERPYGIAWDGDDLLIADPAQGAVIRISPSGAVSRSPEGALESPIGVAVCPTGIVVSDSRAGTVDRLDRELRPVARLAEGLARPTGVACDETSILVVETARHRLLDLGPDGGRRQPIGRRGTSGGEFNFPAAILLGKSSIWIGDTLNFRLQALARSDGGHLVEFGQLGDAPGETPRIKGIARDSAGRLWVTDAHLDRVAIYTETGELLAELGGPGTEPGEFAFPAGIAAHPDGRIAVADSLNRRVQILRLVWEDGR